MEAQNTGGGALAEAAPAARLAAYGRQFQEILSRDPRDTAALIGISMVALGSRQSEAAVQMARAAVDTAPRLPAAWIALAQALQAAARTAEAEHAYRAALRLDGAHPLARIGLGQAKMLDGRAEEAIAEFDAALRRDPRQVAAHLARGHALQALGRLPQALSAYEQALRLQPRLAEAEFGAGFALSRQGRPLDAERRYRRAVMLRPDFAAAWMNLGCLLRDRGRTLYAEAALRRAITLRPEMVAAWINLALLERECGRMTDAEKHLRAALEIGPEQAATHIAWAQFCASEQDYAGAWGWLRGALAREPENDEALNMRGILMHKEGRFEEAVAAFEQAEAAGNQLAASNRGNSLLELGRMDEALHAHATAVERDPHSAGARYNLALTQLRLGRWDPGWANYEARWRFREVHRRPRSFAQPRWCGERLHGERILLHAEQGLGDTIQFCRYATLVAARGGRPILQVQKPVARLLESLAVVRSGEAEIALLDETAPEFAMECPLMSLPAVFQTQLDTVPWTGAYLGADAAEIAAKRSMFASKPDAALRIGIAWAGNPSYKADQQRSTELAAFLPLLHMPRITWISLQKGEAAGQMAGVEQGVGLIDGCSGDRDLAEAAALMATLDLVITTDTCIAHLAGAMARPVWILLPHLADWRWMQEIGMTPWYPTARLLRQSAPGDWDELMARVSARLGSVLDDPECSLAEARRAPAA